MLKQTGKILIILVMTIFMSVCFVGCPFNSRESLNTPTIATVSKNSSEFKVATDEVQNASGYIFEISKLEKGEAVEYYSSSNSFNVQNIMVDKQCYQIRVKAVGKGKYKNSDFSEVKYYANKNNVQTPILSLSGTTLSWTNVANNSGFLVKINNSENFIEISESSVDFSENDEMLALINENSLNNFCVKAVGETDFDDSDFSNIVSYASTSQLASVNSLEVEETETDIVLKWAKVEIENVSYKVKQSNQIIAETEQNSVSIKNNLENAKEYKFSVQVVSTNEYVYDSEWAEEITYCKQDKLNAPIITSITRNGENIIVKWGKVNNALSYEIFVNEVALNDGVSECQALICKAFIDENDFSELNITIKAKETPLFKESSLSEINQFSYYIKLNCPTNVKVSSVDGQNYLRFDAVKNALSYTIIINNEIVEEITETIVNLNTYFTEPKIYSISVKAEANSFYSESEKSDVVAFNYKAKLENVDGIELSELNHYLTISWQEVSNASAYCVCVENGGATVEFSNVTALSYSYLFSSAGNYNVKIKAIGTGSYLNSDYSSWKTYHWIKTLDKVRNLVASESDSELHISWNAVEDANGYTVSVDGDEFTTQNASYILTLSDFAEGTHTVTVWANIQNSTDYAVGESSYINFIIE